MSKFFLAVYRYFAKHKSVFYVVLIASSLVFGYFGLKIKLNENIAMLLPKTEKSSESDVAFGDIRIKDKVFIEVVPLDGTADVGTINSITDQFIETLEENDGEGVIDNVLYRLDNDDLMNILYYAMEALPCHLNEDFYLMLDTLLSEEAIDRIVETQGKDVMPSLGSFTIIENHIFSPDSSIALAFLTPAFNTMDMIKCTQLENLMSAGVAKMKEQYPSFDILYHGTAIEGHFNSNQIKKDIFWTVGISLLIICLLIGICFKTRNTLLLILAPVLYGTLFSLACIYWVKGEMSLIALGIGAIVLGVALSYCLHVLTHYKFVGDPEKVIQEQARPVCLGCITTIGAFAGLFFTSSELLRDFGIFASLALVGTTLFALVFLPHFFTPENNEKNEKAFKLIEKINSYPLDRNVVVVSLLVVLCIVSFFTAKRVKFDSDLNNIGYLEPKMVRSEEIYNQKVNGSKYCQYYAAYANDLDSAIMMSVPLNQLMDSLQKEGVISSYGSTEFLLISEQEQWENIARWKAYWTPEKADYTYRLLKKEAQKHNWQTPGFDVAETFRLMVDADYMPVSLYDSGALPDLLLCNFVEHNDSGWLIFTSALLDEENLKQVNDAVAEREHLVVMDPFYYAGDMVEIVHDDFSKVLLISSLFVFLVLLLAFRNIFVSIIAFLPMMLSWFIVQGLMAIFGIDFNLINIMISSFIFGIGVDYSIFVMEGLINKAKYNSYRLLTFHKMAIFFSGAILLIVVSSLLFATHPAIYSIGISTIIGMTSTILITYALQPLLFRGCMKVDFLRKSIIKK
ncbi:MAG: MMPL family transporter [Bacteroidales bacterium]|nr:MMPL family transporter [Bacteroidales bacterium]